MTAAWEKKLKAARDNAMRRPELETNGGTRTEMRSAGITSAPVKVVDVETRRLIDEARKARSA